MEFEYCEKLMAMIIIIQHVNEYSACVILGLWQIIFKYTCWMPMIALELGLHEIKSCVKLYIYYANNMEITY